MNETTPAHPLSPPDPLIYTCQLTLRGYSECYPELFWGTVNLVHLNIFYIFAFGQYKKEMTNSDFWDSIQSIIKNGFNPEGLAKLEEYADKFINGKLLFKRFSPQEQHGCAEGGSSHVIASILAGAENPADTVSDEIRGFKRTLQQAARQASFIESWARKTGIWCHRFRARRFKGIQDTRIPAFHWRAKNFWRRDIPFYEKHRIPIKESYQLDLRDSWNIS